MKKIVISVSILFFCLASQAQSQLHESFNKEKELKEAFVKFDMSSFFSEKTSFVCDTIEKEVNVTELNLLMKTYIPMPKNTQVRKASETNNGYIQTFGIYKGDDALYYIRFTLSPLNSKLEEVSVEKNN
jgi:hypothetical protein